MRPPAWTRHWPLAVVLVVGLILRGRSTDGLGAAQLAGLVSAVAGYAVAVRWHCWHWLAALAVVPALADARLLGDQDLVGSAALVLVALGVLAACWRGRRTYATWLAGAGTVVVAVVVGPAAATPARDGSELPWPVLVVLLGIALAAVAGVGRADGVPDLRLVALAGVLVPVPVVLPGWPWTAAALVWWPVAAAVGLTALLRGRRGPASDRRQCDEIDEAASADFHARYPARRLAPVAIVIAAYDEATGLPAVVDGLPTEVCGLTTDVLVVDDGSTDGTADAIKDTRALVAACPANRGQGAALRLGYRLAREQGARFIVTTDADGQYDAGDIATVLAPILAGRADFVTGSRILGRQHTRDRVRRLGVHVFAWIATAFTGLRLTDTSFGLRAMRAEVTAAVTLNQPQYQSSELLLGVVSHGFRVLEVPATMHLRSAGSTKKGRNLVYGWRYAKVVLGTWWREGCLRPIGETTPRVRHTGDRAT